MTTTDADAHNEDLAAEAIELDSNFLMSRLRVIEDQPLEFRAAAFAQLHDTLQRRLEGEDSTASRG